MGKRLSIALFVPSLATRRRRAGRINEPEQDSHDTFKQHEAPKPNMPPEIDVKLIRTAKHERLTKEEKKKRLHDTP